MDHVIGVIGLGYVGLPLAVEFGRVFDTIGVDINTDRITELRQGTDRTKETNTEEIREASHLVFTSDIEKIRPCNTYIITVPTPIDKYKRPDISALLKASDMVGSVLSKGDIVIFESTVYPGCTEEDCVPVMEKASGLRFNQGFFAGYSPERINPGDKKHRLKNIKKITSGSTPDTAEIVDRLYNTIIAAGTHPAPSIKVAEAAKVIENTQRDINIAFINELSMIFARMGIRTKDVLDAAQTKWNFLPFEPGLVGGHCIGVDPYYLTHKAEETGYLPQMILAGRRINDGMGRYVATSLIKMLIRKKHRISDARILVMGLTFKENCPDIRNTRVMDVVEQLRDFSCSIDVFEPEADPDEVKQVYNIDIITRADSLKKGYEGIIMCVAHDAFRDIDIETLRARNSVVYDVKNILKDADAWL
ncbi:MAG: nucleotide sugar dehydrogenase [Thermodesulfobacteriota bacterium]|nr:nucleotide sugar dehydrogenase [Thermodesulfobacteriota bacterium]